VRGRALKLRGQRVLVLGASGFIGRWVAARLERAGSRVTPVVRDSSAAAAAFAMAGVSEEPLLTDLADLDELERIVREMEPRVTFNLAGYGVDRSERDPDLARHLNVELPRRLGRVLLDQARRQADGEDEAEPALVHAGSALEYGLADRVGEGDPTAPNTDYGRTKLEGTEAVSAAARGGLRAVTARLFTVYGPGEHAGRLLPSLLEAVGGDQPIELTEGFQKRDFTYVEDVVEGLVRLGRCPRAPSVVNLATGRLTSVRRFVELAARELLLRPEQLRFGARPSLAEDMEHAPVPVERLRETVGWGAEMSIPEGVRSTAQVLRIGGTA